MIFKVRPRISVPFETQIREDGTEKHYVVVPLTRLPRIPLEEFIIGPEQDQAAGRARAEALLAEVKYQHPDRRVVLSSAALPRGV